MTINYSYSSLSAPLECMQISYRYFTLHGSQQTYHYSWFSIFHTVKAKFHYAIQVADLSQTGSSYLDMSR